MVPHAVILYIVNWHGHRGESIQSDLAVCAPDPLPLSIQSRPHDFLFVIFAKLPAIVRPFQAFGNAEKTEAHCVENLPASRAEKNSVRLWLILKIMQTIVLNG